MPSQEEVLKGKIEDLGKAFAEFKTANDERVKALESRKAVDPTLDEKVNKANDAITKYDEEIKALKAALNRPNRGNQEVDEKAAKRHQEYKATHPFMFKEGVFSTEADAEYKSAMDKYLRRGNEEKALSVGVAADGGFLVRPEVGDMIKTVEQESSPFRQHMGQVQISSDAFEAPTDGSNGGAQWVGEVASRSATATPTLGQLRISVHELMASPKATQKLLDDASINVESWLGQKAAEDFAIAEATAFASGTGVKSPRGFLTYDAGTSAGQIEQVISGSAATLTADGLINLVAALKSAYTANAMFFANRSVIAVIRKLKDGNGQYLWLPGFSADKSNTLLGYPIAEAADMPNVGSSALSVAFGDFKKGYLIVDRIGMRLLRDPFTAKPYVQFDYTKRVGGGVVVHEAIKIQKCST